MRSGRDSVPTNRTIVNKECHVLNTEVGLHVLFGQQSRARNKAKELLIYVFPSLLFCKRVMVLVIRVQVQTIQPSERKRHLLLNILRFVRSTTHHAQSTTPTPAARFPAKRCATCCSLCCDNNSQQRDTGSENDPTPPPSSSWDGTSTGTRSAPWRSSYRSAVGTCPKRRFRTATGSREAPLYDHRKEVKRT